MEKMIYLILKIYVVIGVSLNLTVTIRIFVLWRRYLPTVGMYRMVLNFFSDCHSVPMMLYG